MLVKVHYNNFKHCKKMLMQVQTVFCYPFLD